MRGMLLSATILCATVGGWAGVSLAADVGQGEKIIVTPSQGRVGQTFKFKCVDFPQPTNYEVVYVVAAGTPDFDLQSPAARDYKILWQGYATNCFTSGSFYSDAGPFAPGSYEVRLSSTLYNNDKRGEIATRTVFTVH